MIEIKSVEQITVLSREGDKEIGWLLLKVEDVGKGKEIMIMRVPIIFERYEQWENGLKTDSNKIGDRSPDCLRPPPLPRGKYLCRCGKHLLLLGDHSVPDSEVEIYLRQVVVLP